MTTTFAAFQAEMAAPNLAVIDLAISRIIEHRNGYSCIALLDAVNELFPQFSENQRNLLWSRYRIQYRKATNKKYQGLPYWWNRECYSNKYREARITTLTYFRELCLEAGAKK